MECGVISVYLYSSVGAQNGSFPALLNNHKLDIILDVLNSFD